MALDLVVVDCVEHCLRSTHLRLSGTVATSPRGRVAVDGVRVQIDFGVPGDSLNRSALHPGRKNILENFRFPGVPTSPLPFETMALP